ncbi:hypothetical protein E2C01_031989 [Portunus trituberculatus]|uniref:Uncharacterized protein n=1 Tax=Portunus trituberculatus TaxID=210409 RepID=A0A5B7EW93_PORTR|nr:hypothetical protein [Portunus trituberculatus]
MAVPRGATCVLQLVHARPLPSARPRPAHKGPNGPLIGRPGLCYHKGVVYRLEGVTSSPLDQSARSMSMEEEELEEEEEEEEEEED